MVEHRYLNFDLRIDALREGYRAWVSNAPVSGEAAVEFALPQDVIQNRFPASLSAAQMLGKRLFETIFDQDVLTYLRRSQEIAEKQDAGLRLRLSLSGAPELARLPWEMLYDPSFDHFFSLSTATPVVRYLDLPREAQALQVTLPLKVLVMISSPDGYQPLDVEAEWQRLQQALDGLVRQKQVILERMPDANLASLQRILRRSTYHIFHFVGHGGFDEEAQDGLLLLEDENGKGTPVSSKFLGTLLQDQRTLQLVNLNACQGGTAGREDPFAGSAPNLVQRGIPAVVAMQRAITDDAAILFTQEFYSALADGYPVDSALVEGRKAIFSTGSPVEWGTPVLYMRSPDGRLFDLPVTVKSVGRTEIKPMGTKTSSRVDASDTKILTTQKAQASSRDLSDYAGEIDDLSQQLARGRLVLFLGADLPMEVTGMPARQDLSDELAGQEGLDAGGRLASVTQLVMSHGNRWAFTDFLQGALDSVGKELQPYHQAVVEMVQVHQVEMIVSMAYDDLLEQAFHQSGVGLNVVVSDEQLGFVRPDRPTLIKLYGDIRQVASLTVTEQDQNALLRGRVKAEIVDEVQRAFRRNTILFVGYDLNDPFVAVWFDEIAGGRFQSRSYAVWSGLPDQQAAALESNRGLIVLDTDPVAVLYTLAGKRR